MAREIPDPIKANSEKESAADLANAVLHQELPEKDPSIRLEELEKRLRETPTYKTLDRELLQSQIDNLKKQIRARRGLEIAAQQPSPAKKHPRLELQDLEEKLKNGRLANGTHLSPSMRELLRRRIDKLQSEIHAQKRNHGAIAELTAHFGVIPVTDSMKRGLDRIREGFSRARSQLLQMGKKELAGQTIGFEARYTKAYLERENLPQAIKIARQGLEAGYQVIVATQTTEQLISRTREGNFITFDELSNEVNNQFSQIVPPLTDVYRTLRTAFGGKLEDYTGRSDSLSEKQAREKFLVAKLPMLYTTYAVGGGALSLCDTDYPDRAIFGGGNPRVSIFLGPPLSGALLRRAVGLIWRPRVKSDAHVVFLATDSETEVSLMQQRVGPLLRVLGAHVLGERESLASTLSAYTDEQRTRALEDALAYAEGDGIRVYPNSFQVRSKSRIIGINDWSLIKFPPAETAKHKEIIVGTEVTDAYLRTHYLGEFCVQGPDSAKAESGNEAVDAVSRGANSEQGELEGISVQNLDSANRNTPVGVTSAAATEEELGQVRESLRNADQKAMFSLAALIAILAFLITHNAPAGWFKGIGQWSLADLLGLVSTLGLAVAASMMLVILYPSLRYSDRGLRFLDAITKPDRQETCADRAASRPGDYRTRALQEDLCELTKVCIAKYRTLRWGFWVGIAAAFLSLLFLILSKKPHVAPAVRARYY